MVRQVLRRFRPHFGASVNPNRSVRRVRTGYGLEKLEDRRVLAGNVEFLSMQIVDGEFHMSEVIDSTRLATAERIGSWVESELGIQMSNLAEGALSGQVIRDRSGVETRFTFAMEGMEWDFRETADGLQFVETDARLFHNSLSPMDTSGDGELEPIDALLILNYLNRASTMLLPNRAAPEMSGKFIDVTGDRWVTPTDALLVINTLNRGNRGGDGSLPFVPADDYFAREVSASETEFPASEIDVLANDLGRGLRLVELTPAQFGTVEIVDSSSGRGTTVRYQPGEGFTDLDSFTYVVEDDAGNLGTASVVIQYSRATSDTSSIVIIAPEGLDGEAPGAPIQFRDAAGNGLISIEVLGEGDSSIGVLVSFAPNEAPFGLAIAGTLSSDAATRENFYPEPQGGAWITGTVGEVNAILAGLRYDPAPGFSAPEGFGLSIFAFLYNDLGVSVDVALDSVMLSVPALPEAPLTTSDFYEFDGLTEPVRLDVLANDRSPVGSVLRLVGVSQYPAWNALAIRPHFGSTIEIDRETNQIIYTPGMFGFYESFVYVVADSEGRLSQGKVAISLVNEPRIPA